ncbi:MAG: hypothetical protein WBW93_16465 [Steroidobacteraceae bacterium]
MSTPKATGKTIADFRAAHDKNVIVPAKIKKALADMEAEHAENWSYESDFMKRAGISQTDVGMFRDQFSEHIVETSGHNAKKVWFASAKVAAKVR